MSIEVKQIDGGVVSPRDDAILYNAIIAKSGIFRGMEITHLGSNQIKISEGNGIIKGRCFEMTEEVITCDLATSGTMKGRVYLHLDLSNPDEPLTIKHVTAATLPDLVQDEDCNWTNGIYEVELCTYNASDYSLSDVTTTYEYMENALAIIDDLATIKANTRSGFAAGALAVKELSNNLDKKMFATTSSTSSMTMVKALGYVCDNIIELGSSNSGTFQCSDKGWCAFHSVTKSTDNYCSGFVRANYSNTQEAYQFYKRPGADPVLKKLGSATISGRCAESAAMNDTSHSGTYTYSGLDAHSTMVFSNNIPANGYGNITISGSSDGSSYTKLYYTSSASTNVSIDISNYSYIGIAINVYHRAISSHSQWATIGVDWTFS